MHPRNGHLVDRLVGGATAGTLASWVITVSALGWTYASTGEPAWVAAVAAARVLPGAVLGGPVRLLFDRRGPRATLLIGTISSFAIAVGLAVAVGNRAPTAVLVVLVMAAAFAENAGEIALAEALPAITDESRIAHVRARLQRWTAASVVLGAAVGALMSLTGAATVAFAVGAGTFLVALALLRAVPLAPPARTALPIAGSIRPGRSGSKPILLATASTNVVIGAQFVQLVIAAQDRFGMRAEEFGYLIAAAAVGALMRSVVNARVAVRPSVSTAIASAAGVVCACELGFALTRHFGVALVIALSGGIGFVTAEVITDTATTRVAPAETRTLDSVRAVARLAGVVLAPIVILTTSLRVSFVLIGLAGLVGVAVARAAMTGLDAASRTRVEVVATRLAVIARIPVIAELPRGMVEAVAGSSQICPIPPGVDVVVQGAPAHAFYAIVDGGVVVHRAGTEVARLGPGDHFGERGLLDQSPRNATVTTTVATTLLRVDGQFLLAALGAAPGLRPAIDLVHRTHDESFVDDPTFRRAP